MLDTCITHQTQAFGALEQSFVWWLKFHEEISNTYLFHISLGILTILRPWSVMAWTNTIIVAMPKTELRIIMTVPLLRRVTHEHTDTIASSDNCKFKRTIVLNLAPMARIYIAVIRGQMFLSRFTSQNHIRRWCSEWHMQQFLAFMLTNCKSSSVVTCTMISDEMTTLTCTRT